MIKNAVKFKKIIYILILAAVNMVCASIYFRIEYVQVSQAFDICEPSAADIMGLCVNRYCKSFVISALILLNAIIITSNNLNAFIVKYKSVRSFKRRLSTRLIFISMLSGGIFFLQEIVLCVGTKWKLFNWYSKDSYYYYLQHCVTSDAWWRIYLYYALCCAFLWLILSHMYYFVYVVTKRKAVSFLLCYIFNFFACHIFTLSIIPCVRMEMFKKSIYIKYTLGYLAVFLMLSLAINKIDYRRINRNGN